MPLAWDLRTQISNLDRQFCVLKLLKTRRPYSPASASAAGLMKVMSSCRPILVISLGASSSDLEGKLQPEHEHNLHGP